MNRIYLVPVLILISHFIYAQAAMPLFEIPFERDSNQTLEYDQIIACYKQLEAAYPDKFKLTEAGSTDIGKPLHLGILSLSGEFNPLLLRSANKRILLINNGIHPGEPEGIDATVMLLRDILEDEQKQNALEHTVIAVIPVYNVGGCLNRSAHSRANQNGPAAYGFRGNAKNYDLNRDFVKCDSKNAQSFNAIFQRWSPDVFIDNHTSNGADYQYTMTLIATQEDKLEKPLGEFVRNTMLPWLYKDMAKQGWDLVPYVDGPGPTPDEGIFGFCDYGRYSTGYAAMWNTIGFMPETHMLKPFKDRLLSTYAFMESVIDFMHKNGDKIGSLRAKAWETTKSKDRFVLDWRLDTSRHEPFTFKGYTAKYKPSEVSGLPRLWYDRSEPFEKEIQYYNHFLPSVEIDKPLAYIIPQAWTEVIERLQTNSVVMEQLEQDDSLETESYYIRNFRTRDGWEGHHYHYRVEVEKKTMKRAFQKGDYIVYLNQYANRYLMETLEPTAPDSWFAWNFFEPVLMQKEYFSSYVFEDLAAEFLRENPELREELEKLKKSDPEFAGSARRQLDWVYRRSPWYEPTHRLYPVARLMKPVSIYMTSWDFCALMCLIRLLIFTEISTSSMHETICDWNLWRKWQWENEFY